MSNEDKPSISVSIALLEEAREARRKQYEHLRSYLTYSRSIFGGFLSTVIVAVGFIVSSDNSEINRLLKSWGWLLFLGLSAVTLIVLFVEIQVRNQVRSCYDEGPDISDILCIDDHTSHTGVTASVRRLLKSHEESHKCNERRLKAIIRLVEGQIIFILLYVYLLIFVIGLELLRPLSA